MWGGTERMAERARWQAGRQMMRLRLRPQLLDSWTVQASLQEGG